MIKHWQSMQDYKCFLRNSKVSFDSSERIRLHTELWRPWQKLRLLDIDIAMDFLLPFYSAAVTTTCSGFKSARVRILTGLRRRSISRLQRRWPAILETALGATHSQSGVP